MTTKICILDITPEEYHKEYSKYDLYSNDETTLSIVPIHLYRKLIVMGKVRDNNLLFIRTCRDFIKEYHSENRNLVCYESTFALYPYLSLYYATQVLKGQFLKGEATLKNGHSNIFRIDYENTFGIKL